MEFLLNFDSWNWHRSNNVTVAQDILSETISRYGERCASSEASFTMPTLLLHGAVGQVQPEAEESDTCRRPGASKFLSQPQPSQVLPMLNLRWNQPINVTWHIRFFISGAVLNSLLKLLSRIGSKSWVVKRVWTFNLADHLRRRQLLFCRKFSIRV